MTILLQQLVYPITFNKHTQYTAITTHVPTSTVGWNILVPTSMDLALKYDFGFFKAFAWRTPKKWQIATCR